MIPKLCLLLGCAAVAFGAQPGKIFPYDYSQEDLPNGCASSRPTITPTSWPPTSWCKPGRAMKWNRGTPASRTSSNTSCSAAPEVPSEKYNQTLNRIGAASNASTDDDLTVFHTTFSKEDLDTVLAMEADRFQHLKYTEPDFKTESLAVLGEYNKNSASPFSKLNEVLHDTAFDKHTYKHTTMGFLKDIQDMPNQYEYSLKFFDRYYRPEYTTIVVVGT